MFASLKQNVLSTVWSGAVKTDWGAAQLTGATGLSQAAMAHVTTSARVSGKRFVDRNIVVDAFS